MKKILSTFSAAMLCLTLFAGCGGTKANTVHTADDLKNKTIGVQLGTTGDALAGDVEGALEKDWTHELTGVFYEDGYTSTPDNDDMRIRDTQPIDDMWMYHAVSQAILAGKVLESFDVVDNNKIGAVGISWGSVILSITLGYKNNFAYAIPVYGSGYLTESLSYMRYKFILPRVQDLWLAEKNFNNVKIPVLWICMNNDFIYLIKGIINKDLPDLKENGYTVACSRELTIIGKELLKVYNEVINL